MRKTKCLIPLDANGRGSTAVVELWFEEPRPPLPTLALMGGNGRGGGARVRRLSTKVARELGPGNSLRALDRAPSEPGKKWPDSGPGLRPASLQGGQEPSVWSPQEIGIPITHDHLLLSIDCVIHLFNKYLSIFSCVLDILSSQTLPSN